MSGIIIRKKNGDLIELESDQTLDAADLQELLGDQDDKVILNQLIALTEAIKSQKPPVVNVAAAVVPKQDAPVVNVDVAAPVVNMDVAAPLTSTTEAPKDWKGAELKITKWDSRGRIESMSINKIY